MMKKKIIYMSFLLTLIFMLANCGFTPLINTNANGILYSNVTNRTRHPKQGASAEVGSKSIEACSHRVLSLVSFGDTGLINAANNAGITKIYTVDEKTITVLAGVYYETCTIISGD